MAAVVLVDTILTLLCVAYTVRAARQARAARRDVALIVAAHRADTL